MAAQGKPVTGTVTSRDGTPIAFETSGEGPAVVLVASALADRRDTRKLATLLSDRHTVVNYDRRGRGDSGDHDHHAVEREIDDLAALVKHVGGSAALFGSSSGAVLALRAAGAGIGVTKLAVYEPPFVVRPDSGFGPPPGFADRLTALLDSGDRAGAVRAFMTEAQGMPSAMVTMMRLIPGVWSTLTGLAHTLPYDLAVMGDTQQGAPLRAGDWASVTCPTLVLTGGKSPAGFHDAARALAAVLPDAEHRTLPKLNHGAVMQAPGKLAGPLTEFLR
ncbi:alpha/beta fold hydrolase [Saccharomonospora xinjiangensis]|uniref:Putative hydrolase or acyltransferase of alpha/beta superfamily n=1 Tax=Saccharomonospora xinjiangensis XJ-54 TaxID=882086 RepID=I0V8I8_9PSEU|nr:alpha/beta hydrolase [Saccharomonospora xinjiangensis]EID56441.1 putative hydrolase or acyltransferase of alpha/beta superfamily [Saccharomonospora xinjiangensis XJ-54]